MDEQSFLDLQAQLSKLVAALEAKRLEKDLLTAKEVGALTGLDHRTILNRSALKPHDKRFIPFVKIDSSRKYFEKKVILRLFKGRI